VTSALVLGAGGTVGIAYHAGVLRALEEVGGFRPDDADLVVGTSAGSMIGAMLRSGLSTEELWRAALGEHDEISVGDSDDAGWGQAWHGPVDAVRRAMGSAYVLQRTLWRFPVPALPRALQRLFPGGFFTIGDAEDTLAQVMPTDWPTKPLWLVSVDVPTGRRVILGRRNPPRTDLHTAVKASCAIPAFFLPVRVGRRVLVDGGVHSTTNLDLSTKIRPDVIVGVVPMAFDPSSPPRTLDLAFRRFAQARLHREADQAERRGSRVLLIRPSHDDLDAMGHNMMRRDGNEAVTRIAYDSAARQLDTARSREILDQLHETLVA
jgi:NTE family protein